MEYETKDKKEKEEKGESKQHEQGEAVTQVLKDFQLAYRAKQPKETLFKEIYRRYRGYLEAASSGTRSMLFIPEAFTLVETVAPRMTAKKPTFKVLPRETSDITDADTYGQLADYQWDATNQQKKIKIFDKQRLIYGTSVMKIGYDAKKQLPQADPVDLADIFPSPFSYDWQDDFIIHRYYTTIDKLKQSKVKYKNLDKLEVRVNSKSSVRDDQMRQDRNSIQDIPVEPNRPGIEILEHHGWEDGKPFIKTVADRTVCIRNERSKLPKVKGEYRLPFVVAFDQEVPFELWGIGEIEPIMDLQDEENTTRNQRIDEKNLSVYNMWVVSKTSGIDYRKLVSKPGGIILATDINGIKALDKQNITQNSLEELKLIKEDIRNVTGVNDFVRGDSTGGSTTATETVTKTQEANQRFAQKSGNLEMAIKEIGEWFMALTAEFVTDDMKIRVTGKYGPEIKEIKAKEAIKYDLEVETGSSLPANPELRRQQLRELVQVVAPFVTNPQGIPDGLRELLRNLIQSYDLKNADEILQGAEHPKVGMAMANIGNDELDGVNPQLVQQEIKKLLMGGGELMGPEQQAEAGLPPQPGLSEGTGQPGPPIIG